jgi:flagellar hook assembly protein FlgD
VFDISGRRVVTLVDGTMVPGRYSVTWDGRDGAGHPASSGVYAIRLAGGGTTETRSTVLLK